MKAQTRKKTRMKKAGASFFLPPGGLKIHTKRRERAKAKSTQDVGQTGFFGSESPGWVSRGGGEMATGLGEPARSKKAK